MLVLYTDFGSTSPYVGLMKQAVFPYAPHSPIVDLCHDLIEFDSQAASYLLASLATEFPTGSVFVGVVDPGVGSDRDGVIVEADGRYFVGPDNGLFDRVAARAAARRRWRIFWHGSRVSVSFHGRDIFAPVAAQLAAGTAQPDELGEPIEMTINEWPDDLARLVYKDRYGNLITGIRAASLGRAIPKISGVAIEPARVFSDVAPGEPFFYANSFGLIEIAVNRGSAALYFGRDAGDPVELDGEALTSIRTR